MKKLIGLAAFVTIGLFGFTHEAPSAQVDPAALSSPMAADELVAQGPLDNFGCPSTRPHCCEPDGTSCLLCIKTTQQCP